MKTLSKRATFFVFIAVLFFGLSGGALWYIGYYTAKNKKTENISSYAECVAAGNPVMESYPERCAAQGKTFNNPDQSVKTTDTVTSGKQGFTVEIPRGWGQFLNATDADHLILMGSTQPVTDVSKPVDVKNTDAYGSDGGVLFSIFLDNAYEFAPEGTKTAFTIGKGSEALTGMKVSYEYPADQEVGIGTQRFKGDKDYYFIFKLSGNRQLTVTYSVYASDPRNLITQVESIVGTIRVKDR